MNRIYCDQPVGVDKSVMLMPAGRALRPGYGKLEFNNLAVELVIHTPVTSPDEGSRVPLSSCLPQIPPLTPGFGPTYARPPVARWNGVSRQTFISVSRATRICRHLTTVATAAVMTSWHVSARCRDCQHEKLNTSRRKYGRNGFGTDTY